MPASVLIDRPTPEATTGSLPSAGLGPPGEVAPPSAVHQEEPRAGDSFALQLANFARSTTNANVSEYSLSQGKQPAFGPMGAGSSPVLGRCGPPVTMQHQGPSSAAQLTNRKSMNMTECVHVASSEHVAEIVGRQGSKIKALRAKTNTYIKTPVRGEEPVFVVTGRKEDVAAAKKEILSIAEHFGQIRAGRLNNNTGNRTSSALGHLNTDIPGHVTIHVRVPYRVVGLVVGPKGATIKRIQQDSQTYIVTPSRDREPIFEVTGLSENVEKARCEIESYIALRTGTGLSETGLNSSNNTATMFRPFSRNSGLLEDLPGKDAQLLLGSVFKPPSCNTMTSSALASFNNTLNLSMAAKNHPLAENGAEQCGGLYQGLLTANKKLDGVLPNFVSTAGLQNEFGVYNSSKAFEKLVSPYCNNNLLANDFWSQVNNLETPLLLDGLTSFFPSAEEIAALQNEQLMSDCNARTLDSLNFTSSLSLFGNCNGDIDKSGKDKNLCGQLMVNSGAPAYIATVHSGSVGSASNSPSVSPTDSVGSPGQRRRRCIICSDGDVVAALVPCGHNLFCMECAQAVLERTDQLERRCPVCQQTASLAVRIIS